MPRDKSKNHGLIMTAARKEFLEKGYEKASIRSIAAEVGMTSAGLYRHFKDKEAMFAALVDPVLEQLEQLYKKHESWDYELLHQMNLEPMWEEGMDVSMLLKLIYDYFDEFRLIICCSKGTKYANFVHDFVMLEQEGTEKFLEEAKKLGYPVREIKSEELHLLMSAYITSIFEMVVHNFSRENAVHYLDTLKIFFNPGWRAILGI